MDPRELFSHICLKNILKSKSIEVRNEIALLFFITTIEAFMK